MVVKHIKKPLLFGNYANGGGEMAWAWWKKHHSKLAIIGSEELSPRKEIVEKIANKISERDDNAVFWITTNKEEPGITNPDDSIKWVEEFPDPPEEYIDRETYIENRQFFSKTYFDLLASSLNISRIDLMPLSSYKRHLEGPLMGYKRIIDSLSEDHTYKEILLNHLNLLMEVPWLKTKQGRKFIIQETDNLHVKTMSLITAIWSFWAMTCKADQPQQMILILDLPKELLEQGVSDDIQSAIYEALNILTYISSVTTTSLVFSSEMLYPIADLNVRFKLIFKTRDSDIDLSSAENRAIINPLLNDLWDSGNHTAGYWVDSYVHDNVVVTVSEDKVEFWDDYVDADPE